MVLSYTVKFSTEGLRRFKKLDKRVAEKLIEKIELLSDYQSLNTVKKMSGKDKKDFYRMRVGNLRVLFRVIEKDKTVWVVDMGFRGGIYR